ncbi:hypothetical protein X777_05823 [Ooceraea biroi]|uniref:Uncharacterized protein n=1 Tax=Ooceraea biroi TaxID=2015173 RepID=A0A026WD30_OOCBI|nr:hypothetical protein X777_05823 [Ooceraea biroi]
MADKKLLIDPEYEWIFRTCANAFNVYITMMHFTFYDNTLTLRPENSEISLLSYTLFMTALDLLAYCIYQ